MTRKLSGIFNSLLVISLFDDKEFESMSPKDNQPKTAAIEAAPNAEGD